MFLGNLAAEPRIQYITTPPSCLLWNCEGSRFAGAIVIDSAFVLQCPNKHTGEIQAKVRSLPATNFNIWVIVVAADRVSTKTMQRNWCNGAPWTCTPKSSNKLSKNGTLQHLKTPASPRLGSSKHPLRAWANLTAGGRLKLTTFSGIFFMWQTHLYNTI